MKQADANHKKLHTNNYKPILKQAEANHEKVQTKQLSANQETSWRQSQEITY